MLSIITISKEHVARWRNERLRKALRRSWAQEAFASKADGALDEIDAAWQARLWARIDTQVKAEDRIQAARAAPSSNRRRLIWWSAPLVALATLTLLVLTRTPSPELYDGVKGGAESAYAPQIEALRLAVVDERGKVQRVAGDQHIKVGDALVFEAEVRGLDPARGLLVTLAYTVNGGSEALISDNFSLKADRQPFLSRDGYIAFKPAYPGYYTFKLRSAKPPQTAREVRLYVDDHP